MFLSVCLRYNNSALSLPISHESSVFEIVSNIETIILSTILTWYGGYRQAESKNVYFRFLSFFPLRWGAYSNAAGPADWTQCASARSLALWYTLLPLCFLTTTTNGERSLYKVHYFFGFCIFQPSDVFIPGPDWVWSCNMLTVDWAFTANAKQVVEQVHDKS